MTNQHPITPTENLIHKWEGEWHHHRGQDSYEEFMAKQAAQWGADAELEACVQWITEQTCFHPNSDLIKDLRAARRPKPPSLKEQALHALGAACDKGEIDYTTFETIKRALEALPND
jgi:hypothetical protein